MVRVLTAVSSGPQHQCQTLGMATHVCNPSAGVGVGGRGEWAGAGQNQEDCRVLLPASFVFIERPCLKGIRVRENRTPNVLWPLKYAHTGMCILTRMHTHYTHIPHSYVTCARTLAHRRS